MKILRIIILIAICSTLGFTMGVDGCSGSIESPALESGVNVTQDAMDMPLVTEVALGSDLGSPCLLNYIPNDINFYFLLDPQDITDTMRLLRIDLLPDADQVNEALREAETYIDQVAGFVTDEGEWAMIVEGKTGFLDYLVSQIDNLNAARDQDRGLFILRALDQDHAMFSLSQELIDEVVAIVEQGIESECTIYRITQCHYEDSQPMLYVVAMGRTSMLNTSLSKADIGQDIMQNYVLNLGIDKKEDVFRFTIGVFDVNSLEVVLATELHVDLGNIIMQTLIENVMSGEIDFGIGGDDEGDDGGGEPLPQ